MNGKMWNEWENRNSLQSSKNDRKKKKKDVLEFGNAMSKIKNSLGGWAQKHNGHRKESLNVKTEH